MYSRARNSNGTTIFWRSYGKFEWKICYCVLSRARLFLGWLNFRGDGLGAFEVNQVSMCECRKKQKWMHVTEHMKGRSNPAVPFTERKTKDESATPLFSTFTPTVIFHACSQFKRNHWTIENSPTLSLFSFFFWLLNCINIRFMEAYTC